MIRMPLALLVLLVCSLSAPPPLRGQAGVVEGVLATVARPARKTASRYPTGSASARDLQRVAAVVYLSDEAVARGPAPDTVAIVQRDTAFVPSTLAIRTGTVVLFPNEDPFFHNVFSYARNARFDLGRYPQGESREVTFDAPGIARVFCEVHEFMRAVIVVTDHPFHTLVAEDGSFRIEGVPPGEHTVVAYHPDLGSMEQDVTVRAGETVRLTLGADAAGP